jgi:hypothetical protein
MPYKDLKVRKKKAQERWIKWTERHPEQVHHTRWMREYREKNPEKFLIHSARRRAKEKGLEFSITEKDIPIPKICPVLGIPIFKNKDGYQKGPCQNSPTLDRINPSVGYIPSNVRVISWKANKYKSDMAIETLEKILNYMKAPCIEASTVQKYADAIQEYVSGRP